MKERCSCLDYYKRCRYCVKESYANTFKTFSLIIAIVSALMLFFAGQYLIGLGWTSILLGVFVSIFGAICILPPLDEINDLLKKIIPAKEQKEETDV